MNFHPCAVCGAAVDCNTDGCSADPKGPQHIHERCLEAGQSRQVLRSPDPRGPTTAADLARLAIVGIASGANELKILIETNADLKAENRQLRKQVEDLKELLKMSIAK